jgi:predicted DNA-binding transcriptional regulator AlpA
MSSTQLPEVGFVCSRQMLDDREADSPLSPLSTVSRATRDEGIQRGRFPKLIKLSERIAV